MTRLTSHVRSAGGFVLVGLLGWTTADAVNEALVYDHCSR